MSYGDQLFLNPQVEFLHFDTNNSDKVLCTINFESGVQQQFSIPITVKNLLLLFNGERSLHEIEDLNDTYDLSQIERIINAFLVPRKLLIKKGDCSASKEITKKTPTYMIFKKEIISAHNTNKIAPLFNFAFSPYILLPVLITALAALFYIFIFIATYSSDKFISSASSTDAIHTILLIFLGLVFHEFGHAAAAYRYGCRKVSLGVCGYICFLVFYADLTETWRLDRKERIVVDLSGSYFQSIISSIYLALFFLSDIQPFLSAFLLLSLYTLYNMNPFFRMDGYWLASDILDIENLREKSGEVLYRFIRQPIQEIRRSAINKSSPGTRKLFIYTIFMLVFNIWFGYIIVFNFTPDIANDLYSRAMSAFEDGSNKDIMGNFVFFTSTLWVLSVAIFILIFYYRVANALLALVNTHFIRTRNNERKISN